MFTKMSTIQEKATQENKIDVEKFIEKQLCLMLENISFQKKITKAEASIILYEKAKDFMQQQNVFRPFGGCME